MKEVFHHLHHRYRVFYHRLRPTYALLLGYAFYVFVTFILLCLPISRNVSDVSLIDILFTALAVISTSGLQTVNFVETYSTFGQIVVLLGIQVAALGYMTLGSCVIMASKGHISKNRLKIGQAVLAMPESFDPLRFMRHIVFFTLSIELIGALILWFCFWSAGIPNPLWSAIFHSITAFCTAGISIFPDNLIAFSDNAAVSLTIAALSLLGGIGFIVMEDVYRSIKSKSLRTTLTTRIILVATFACVFVGTFFLFFDPTIAEFPLKKRFLTAFFHTVSALTTAGFSTMPISTLAAATTVVVIVLMILGASPSGTGGGLKSTTWSAAIATVLSFFRGKDEITFFGSTVPHSRTTAAFAAITLYMATFAIGLYCLLLFESTVHPFERLVFEVAAALGTVGLSHDITPDLSMAGKIVIMLLMFIGRLGVVALALGAVALYHDISHNKHLQVQEEVKENDIVL
jgi:trk system potassium uptake protein TrkH